jgi:DNA-binding transcriptional LysR family regulator
MQPAMFDVRRLLVLQELNRQGTVHATAAALHLTPSAVSQQLASLSKEVGCQITEKDGRNLRITEAGRLVLAHAADIVAQLETLKGDLERHHLGEVGLVRVGAFQTAASYIVVPAIAALSSAHPDLDVTISQIDAPRSVQEVAAGRLDVALTVEHMGSPPNDDPRFSKLHLLQDEFQALLPATHPLAKRNHVALFDLRDEPWIGNLPGSPCDFVAMAACAAAGFVPQVRHHIDDWAITIELVAAGLGVGLIPTLARPPARDDVAIRPLAGRPAARNIVALVRRGTEESPTIGSVLGALMLAAEKSASSRRLSRSTSNLRRA